MKPKIFIDGQEGTTGLQIYDRLGKRTDIDLLLIENSKRKDTGERRRLLNTADIVFLCLPDASAIEAVSLIENDTTRVIDASTAHRTDCNWVYGFPELSNEHRRRIVDAKRISNPGCHATGFTAIVYPLVTRGVIPKDYPLTCISNTGFSGGGKKMIADYTQDRTADMYSPRMYGLNQQHKHIPEMVAVSGLERAPIFCPIVDDYYSGMATTVTLFNDLLPGKPAATDIHAILTEYYQGQGFVEVAPFMSSGFLESNWGVETNKLKITVCGSDTHTTVTSNFDNLGKGASGAAVQNMNLMLGFEEDAGL